MKLYCTSLPSVLTINRVWAYQLLIAVFLSVFMIFCLNVRAQTVQPGPNIGDLGSVTFYYQNQQVTYTTVRAADSNVWLQQNLGAMQVATASTDASAYGDYFQWGRWDDGHQLRAVISSKAASALAANDPSGLNICSDSFITSPNPSPYWWTNGNENNTWTNNPPSATNGFSPCAVLGSGWHLGDSAEWANILIAENITSIANGFNSNLKFPVTGSKGRLGTLTLEGSGYTQGYWTSTPTEQYSGTPESGGYYAFPMLAGVSSSYAQSGKSVRCLLNADAIVTSDIYGSDTVCRSGGLATFSTYLLGIASRYVWLLPDGSVHESDTNAITVDMSVIESGAISVYVYNKCGDTLAVRTKDIFVSYSEPIITVEENVLGTTGAQGSYQWLKDGEMIPGATRETYIVTENAEYQVVVTNELGCSDTSEVYVVTSIDPSSISADGVTVKSATRIYPNPAKDKINIVCPVSVNISLFTIEGRQILSSEQTKQLSLERLSRGIYLLHITDKQGRPVCVEKIIKQ